MGRASVSGSEFVHGIICQHDHKTVELTGLPRVIGLEPCVLRFLRNLHKQATKIGAMDYVFLNGDGEPWRKDSFSQCFKRWRLRAKLPTDVKAYGLRHAFTISAIEAGVGERQVADQLGHSSTRMVSWYSAQTRTRTAHLRNVCIQALSRNRL